MSRFFAIIISAILFISVGAVMSPVGHLQCLMPMTVGAQDIPSPPPGNPGHEEPAPGSNCVHNKDNPSHNCACHRACEKDENGQQQVKEDPKCRSWCYLKSCSCPIECEGV